MKTLKIICLATAVALACAGSAEARECKMLSSRVNASTLSAAAQKSWGNVLMKLEQHTAEHPEFSQLGKRARFACKSKNNKYRSDKDATMEEMVSLMQAAQADKSPGSCLTRLQLCTK